MTYIKNEKSISYFKYKWKQIIKAHLIYELKTNIMVH